MPRARPRLRNTRPPRPRGGPPSLSRPRSGCRPLARADEVHSHDSAVADLRIGGLLEDDTFAGRSRSSSRASGSGACRRPVRRRTPEAPSPRRRSRSRSARRLRRVPPPRGARTGRARGGGHPRRTWPPRATKSLRESASRKRSATSVVCTVVTRATVARSDERAERALEAGPRLRSVHGRLRLAAGEEDHRRQGEDRRSAPTGRPPRRRSRARGVRARATRPRAPECGSIASHGLHHGAQKSTITGIGDARTSLSNSAAPTSVTVTACR